MNRSRSFTSSSEVTPEVPPQCCKPHPEPHRAPKHLCRRLRPDPDDRRLCRRPSAPPARLPCQPARGRSNLLSRPRLTPHFHSMLSPAPPRPSQACLGVGRREFAIVPVPDCPRAEPEL